MWLSLHRLRINLVVLFMRPEEPDHHDTVFVPHHDDQAIVICFDVKDHSAALENACLRMRSFYVLRCLPLCAFRDGSPRIVLRPGRLDPSMSALRREITLDDVGTDY